MIHLSFILSLLLASAKFISKSKFHNIPFDRWSQWSHSPFHSNSLAKCYQFQRKKPQLKLNSIRRKCCLTTACTKLLVPRAISFATVSWVLVIKIMPQFNIFWQGLTFNLRKEKNWGILKWLVQHRDRNQGYGSWSVQLHFQVAIVSDVFRRFSPNFSFCSSLFPMEKSTICSRKMGLYLDAIQWSEIIKSTDSC